MYVMRRDVTKVTELWREWSIGWAGGPSIMQLNATWGARWKANNECQYYSRRLPIIKAIEGLVARGQAFTHQEAAVTLETLRLQGNISLNRFGKKCAAGEYGIGGRGGKGKEKGRGKGKGKGKA
jgi:hypothetical protein